ncbi:hypothetical protein ABFY59_29400 [Priestia aryabhattai]|uniref:hypothetical protein n=1 Tax=Priestia aryabhattai TaxID=412384 RepID=UPI003D2A2E8C
MTIELLLLYKWWILAASEVIAWIATFYMFYARYWMKSNVQFKVATAIAGITGYVPHISLAIYNYYTTRKVDIFLIAILLFVGVGVILWHPIERKLEKKIKELALRKEINRQKMHKK